VFDKPASVEVARLLGVFNLLQVEIRSLDPGRNTSRVQLDEYELAGPYFPGRFKGDRVWLCVRPEDLKAGPRNGRLGPNQVPATLARATAMPGVVRLEFDRDLAVLAPRQDYESNRHAKDWVIEFPPDRLRVL